MSRDYDCLIVGAGLVGASLALALGGIGLRVAVLDKRKPWHAGRASQDPRGLVLASSSQRILDGLGVWAELRAQVVPIEHIHVSDEGRFGFTHLNCEDVGMPALGYVCPADHLVSSMDGALQAQSACDLFWAATIEGIETGPDRVALNFRLDDVARSVSGAVLVGADGINSAVRRHANIEADTRDYGQTAVVANVAAASRCPATAFERFTRDGPLAFLPLSNARWASVRVVPSAGIERVLNLSDDEYLHDLAVRFGHRLGVFSDLGERHIHPLALSRAHSLTGERCALVGGAANSVHPNAAQGLNLGLRDVATLAESIADAKRTAEDIGARSCLERYAEGRMRDHARVVAFTDLLAQAFASDLASISLMRNAAMLAVDLIPVLKRRLIRSAMGLAGPQPRLVRRGGP